MRKPREPRMVIAEFGRNLFKAIEETKIRGLSKAKTISSKTSTLRAFGTTVDVRLRTRD